MINYLIRVVIIVGENRNTVVIKMLQYRSSTTSTPTLTVFTLADYIHAVTISLVDKFRKLRGFREINIICISFLLEYFKVKVVQFAVKNCIADTAVINVGVVLVDTLYRRIVKADNSGIFRKLTVRNNGLYGFS